MESFKILLLIGGGIGLLLALYFFLQHRTRQIQQGEASPAERIAQDWASEADEEVNQQERLSFDPVVMEAFEAAAGKIEPHYIHGQPKRKANQVGYAGWLDMPQANELVFRQRHWYRARGYVVYRAWSNHRSDAARDWVAIVPAPEDDPQGLVPLRHEQTGANLGREPEAVIEPLAALPLEENLKLTGAQVEGFELYAEKGLKPEWTEAVAPVAGSLRYYAVDKAGELHKTEDVTTAQLLVARLS